MSDIEQFERERAAEITRMGGQQRPALDTINREFMKEAGIARYTYHFDWLGLPIIQLPQDIVAMQETIWRTKPDVIIETGVARGGSLVLSASILQLLNKPGKVIGVDIDIRAHNRAAIEAHPLAHRIALVEGSSTEASTLKEVIALIPRDSSVMVILDSNHTHEHVAAELQLYAPLVSAGCYLVVMDTSIDDMPDDAFPDRPWGPGDNPKTAVHAFLKNTDRFRIDQAIHDKLVFTVARDGYLECLK